MSSTASAPPPVNEPPPPAAVVPAGGIHSISVPTAFTDNPVGFLSSIAARPPSRPGLEQLGGTIAAWISEQCHLAQASAGGGPFSGHQKEATEAEHKQQVAAAAAAEEGKQHSDNHAIGNSDMEFVLIAMEYLRAAGVQLIATVSPPSAAMASPTTAISASGNVPTTTATTTNTNTSSSSSSAMHAALDATTVALQTTVVTTVGLCASICRNQPEGIAKSGIIPTLAQLVTNSHMRVGNQLTPEAIEFLECAMLAQHHHYAAQLVTGTWPSPGPTSTASQVLRYYYLRGVIHIGCNDWTLAHRCFWTCLCIPAASVSRLMIDAWKKLVLIQCIMCRDTSKVSQFRLPKALPKCLEKILLTDTNAPPSTTTGHTASPSDIFQEPSSLVAPPMMGGRVEPHRRGVGAPDMTKKADNFSIWYQEIANAFYRRDKATFEKLVTLHQIHLTTDGNMGLIHLCHQQLVDNQVRHIAKMYSVIPASKVATLLGIASGNDDAVDTTTTTTTTTTEQVAVLLNRSGLRWEAQQDNMIVFHEEEVSATTNLVDLSEWMHLLERIQRLDVNILTSVQYHALVRKEKSNNNNNNSGGGIMDPTSPITAASLGRGGVHDI